MTVDLERVDRELRAAEECLQAAPGGLMSGSSGWRAQAMFHVRQARLLLLVDSEDLDQILVDRMMQSEPVRRAIMAKALDIICSPPPSARPDARLKRW